jgi:heme/copper-type cytochrome/quinol oxidase subunit 2
MGSLVLHTPASAHGAEVDNLMNITWILIFIVQAITQVLLYYFAFKYRGRKIERRYISLIIISWRHFGVLFLPSYWLG